MIKYLIEQLSIYFKIWIKEHNTLSNFKKVKKVFFNNKTRKTSLNKTKKYY